jgi:hypothetical protein
MQLVPDLEPASKWVQHFVNSVNKPMQDNNTSGGLIRVKGPVPTVSQSVQPEKQPDMRVVSNQEDAIQQSFEKMKAKRKYTKKRKGVKRAGAGGKSRYIKRKGAKKTRQKRSGGRKKGRKTGRKKAHRAYKDIFV